MGCPFRRRKLIQEGVGVFDLVPGVLEDQSINLGEVPLFHERLTPLGRGRPIEPRLERHPVRGIARRLDHAGLYSTVDRVMRCVVLRGSDIRPRCGLNELLKPSGS